MRLLIALGGNALAGPAGDSGPAGQIEAAGIAMDAVADLVSQGREVILTHGNGPQVGDVLVRSEIAAPVVPPVPLDWCVAQTQASMGFVLVDALESALARRGLDRRTAVLVTRARVDLADGAFQRPTKPIGRFLPCAEAAPLVAHGQTFADFGERGWRRLVPSPEPLEILDVDPIAALVAAGCIVVANGGGGVPVARDADGSLRGVEAVIDKDLGAALLARQLQADRLVIATDVSQVMLGFGTPQQRPLGEVDLQAMRCHLAAGEFPSGSMGPKVEAACRFVEQTGNTAVIAHLSDLAAAAYARSGTVLRP